jgi:fatty-acyl-CoA synthase
MFVGDYLAKRCVYGAGDVAVVDVTGSASVRHTYAGLNTRADRTANWLLAQGVAAGDRVALVAGDGIAAYDLFFACSKMGAIFEPLNWRLHPREIEDLITRTKPRILLHDGAGPVADIAAHLTQAAGMPPIVSLADAMEEWVDAPDNPVTEEMVTESTTACLLFTGGTTGIPKAAEISHRHIVWNTFNAMLADVRPSDTFLNIFPLFHSGGLFAFTVPLLIMGGTVVQPASFDGDQALRLIEEEKVTIFGGVPTVFQMLAATDGWAKADLSGLRYCLSGGAPMPVPLIERYEGEKGVVFRQGFGMTEFGPDVFSLSSEDSVRKAGSIGKPNFFVDAKVIDPKTGGDLSSGEVGELLLRGPGSMTGYFGDPDATKAAFEVGGWFHTGDMAHFDDEGYCFIVDRLKDMYVSGGENVFPGEVEAVLYELPAVTMCAVVGVPDDRWGETGAAFVVPAQGEALDEATVMSHLEDRLARYKLPRSVEFLPELPVSGAGKILKDRLREQGS